MANPEDRFSHDEADICSQFISEKQIRLIDDEGYFLRFSIKTYVVVIILIKYHYVYFYGEIWKITSKLSSNIHLLISVVHFMGSQGCNASLSVI